MDSETVINKADLLLREVVNVKTTNNNNGPPIKHNVVKEELQYLTLSESLQEQILDTLKYIHGDDFKLNSIDDYVDVKSNIHRKYWVGQGNLVIKGGFDYSKFKDNPEADESERIRQFALLRLISYGFHENHCIEAMKYCDNNVEDGLYLLYNKYFDCNNSENETVCNLSEQELLEQRSDEKSSLESIYDSAFNEKLPDVWIITLKLDYLTAMFHKKEKKSAPIKVKKKELCKNILRLGVCRFGNNCRFSHDIPKTEVNPNAHLEDFKFELEIRFPPNSKYPYEAPLIFLKTDAVLPPLVNLHICKRLHDEAKLIAADGMPSVYSIVELLQNEEEITKHLQTEIDFIPPNATLLEPEKPIVSVNRPSHYKKGVTNRSTRKTINLDQQKRDDKRIVVNFIQKICSEDYDKMLRNRKNLPAWGLRNEIMNTLEKFQVVIISGETGCGKSTQVPQYILDEWISNYESNQKHVEIICTQPRRISAIGVAERVAEERLEKIGNTVGYSIRLENKISSSTRLTFCTTGILLRRLEGEPTLPNVTHVIVDEVHERTEESDFLLLILKELIAIRPDLKVILMSATLNAHLFSDYFGEVPIIDIPGRTFEVQQYFLEDILETTNYILEEGTEYTKKSNKKNEDIEELLASGTVNSVSAMPKDNIKDENLSIPQVLARYKGYSNRTCKNLFLMDMEKINNDLIESILTYIVSGNHNYPQTGTILIFLPGIAEITSLFDQLSDHPDFGKRRNKYIILPLHSSLTNEEQSAIFRKVKHGQRKIVLSTNIAETSITIDDCTYVIDSGRMKEKHFDPNRNMESLETVWVTRANALQRKGRAGRVMKGVCFHLYTSHRFKHHMLPQPIPEIHRIPLEQLVLNIKVLPNFNERDVEQVLNSFIEPPVRENIITAIKRLQDVGALDKETELTPLGHHLAALPVDVRIGKLMLYGAIFGCVDASLTMAACLSFKSPFVSPFGKKDEASNKKRKFAIGYSDQITVLSAYQKWWQVNKKSSLAGRHFATENFLSIKTLTTIADIKHQFLEFLVDIGFVSVNLTGRRIMGQDKVFEVTGSEFNRNAENVRVLSSILCAALYPNVIKVLTPSKSYIMSAAGAVPKENDVKDLKFTTVQETVFMHPSSVNFTVSHFPSNYLVYQEKVQTRRVYFRDCTMVPMIPLVLFSGYELDISVNNGSTFISLENGWILFTVNEHKVAEMLKMIKIELNNLLEEKIQDPLLNLQHHDKGERIISTILNMISS